MGKRTGQKPSLLPSTSADGVATADSSHIGAGGPAGAL